MIWYDQNSKGLFEEDHLSTGVWFICDDIIGIHK